MTRGISFEHGGDLGVAGKFTATRLREGVLEVGPFLFAELVWCSSQAVHMLENLGCGVLPVGGPSLDGLQRFLQSFSRFGSWSYLPSENSTARLVERVIAGQLPDNERYSPGSRRCPRPGSSAF